MFYDISVTGTRSLSHINIYGFLRFFARVLTLYRSDDGLANGLKLVTKRCVTVLCKTVC